MLSEEEKKAIEHLKDYLGDLDLAFNGIIKTETAKDYKIILNLIEKQSKEIEELKEKLKTFKIEDENIYLQFGEIIEKKRWKDKIKAKIEEIKDGTYDAKIILQKLLEE